MSWRRFTVLLAGLSWQSRWQQKLSADKPDVPVLSGAAADAWARSFPKAGER